MRKLILLIPLLLAACTPASAETPAEPALPSPVAEIQPAQELTPLEVEPFFPLALTQQNLDANRYVPGQIDLAATQTLDIPLDGVPQWVLGLALDQGRSLWVAVLEDGRVQAFEVMQGSGTENMVTAVAGFPERIDAGQPPALVWQDGAPLLLNALDHPSNPLNHPLLVGGQLIALDEQGQLYADGELLAEGLLSDGRILSDELARLLLLSQPSNVYDHGILGDELEATALALFDLGSGELTEIAQVSGGQVFEAIMPIWADLNQDGQREILVTASDAAQGARLQLYSETGDLLAESLPIGLGYRWRNQMAIAPFGPNGEWEVADVLTPHITGVVEFFRWEGDELRLESSVAGYTSHVIRTHNLDMGLAADVDADGRAELLLPTQNLESLAAIQHQADGASALWELPLGAKLNSNIASARFADGRLALGLGLDSGVLRVWLP